MGWQSCLPGWRQVQVPSRSKRDLSSAFAFLSAKRLHSALYLRGMMADFKALLSGLREAEAHFEKQLAGIRAAISSLEFGGAVSPSVPGPGTHEDTVVVRKRRNMSAAARAKISAAQKKRWAKRRADAK